MQPENLINNLKQIGLEQKEAEIYLAILHLGKATISDIARKSQVKRTTIYQYIDSLIKNGLLYKTAKGKRIFYIAENPEKITNILNAKKKRIEKIIPDLKNIYNTSSIKPSIKFYEGTEGLRTIYNEIAKTHKIIYAIFSPDKYFAIFSEEENKKFFENIRKNGGEIKDLVENTPLGKKIVQSDRYKGIGSSKLLPKDFKLAVDILIAGNKVAMISLVNLVGIIIENPEIANIQRNFIEFIRKNI